MGMHTLTPAILPGTRIRLHGEAHGLLAKWLEAPEQSGIAHARQSLVDEHLRGREDYATVSVVLQLLCCLVADAHRAVAGKSLEIRCNGLIDRIGWDDTVDRPQGLVGVQPYVGDVVDVLFHGLRG